MLGRPIFLLGPARYVPFRLGDCSAATVAELLTRSLSGLITDIGLVDSYWAAVPDSEGSSRRARRISRVSSVVACRLLLRDTDFLRHFKSVVIDFQAERN